MTVSFLCKGAGAALIVLCGWGTGRVFCQSAARRRRTLAQIAALLQRLREEIGYRRADLPQLYQKMEKDAVYPLLELQPGGSFQTLEPPAVLTEEERTLFTECFRQLGRTTSAQESAQLDYYIQFFDRACRQAAETETQAGRLYGRLGLGVGAMAAILLL